MTDSALNARLDEMEQARFREHLPHLSDADLCAAALLYFHDGGSVALAYQIARGEPPADADARTVEWFRDGGRAWVNDREHPSHAPAFARMREYQALSKQRYGHG